MFRVAKSPQPAEVHSTLTVEGLEALLSDWWGGTVVLTSSGRAALLLLLQHFGLSRYAHRVAIHRFSSQCVVDAVSRAAFPVDAAAAGDADLALIYHQYGFPQLAPAPAPARGIEDICHAFFATARDGVRARPELPAIFSLPKFFSTNSMVGGVVTADGHLADEIRRKRDAAPERSREQVERESEIFRRHDETISSEELYLSRLLNPRISDRELGGLPGTRAALTEARARRRHVAERLIAAAGPLNVPGWAEFIQSSLPYAFPVLADRDGLDRIDKAMREIGVESDIYRIDVRRNMFAPSYVPMLLIPLSHYVSDQALDEMASQLAHHQRHSVRAFAQC
jgi:hypothetical protein